MSRRRLVARAAMQPPDDPNYAILKAHRERAMGRLVGETEALVAEGARTEEIIWVLTPDSACAMVTAELIEGFESRGAHDLARTVATFRSELEPGHCACVYVGPEGELFEWIRIDALEELRAPGEAQAADEEADDAISETIGSALRDLLVTHAFVPPLYCAAIGANGAMLWFRFTESRETTGLDAERLAGHDEGGDGLTPPINLVFTDSRGEAARVLVGIDGVAGTVTILR